MWQKTQRVLTAWGDKRSIQAAALILDMCLFILSFFPRFKLLDFNALILLILFYSLQSLLFNKQGTLLLEAEYIWHKKYAAFMKVGLVVGAIFFVYTLIPIFLYVYISLFHSMTAICCMCPSLTGLFWRYLPCCFSTVLSPPAGTTCNEPQ